MTQLASERSGLKKGDRVMALVGGGGYAGVCVRVCVRVRVCVCVYVYRDRLLVCEILYCRMHSEYCRAPYQMVMAVPEDVSTTDAAGIRMLLLIFILKTNDYLSMYWIVDLVDLYYSGTPQCGHVVSAQIGEVLGVYMQFRESTSL